MATQDSNSIESIVKLSKVSAMGRLICSVVLTENSIYCENLSEAKAKQILFSVPLEDVLGLQILKVPPSPLSNSCRAILCTYQKVSKLFSKATSRSIFKEALEFSESSDFNSNFQLAQEWKEAIQLQCLKNSRTVFTNIDSGVVEHHRFLVVINPFAGSKKSEHLYRTVVYPIFELAGATIVHELITERQGHATEFIQSFDLSTINGIVTASGDGTIYEIVNGLMARPDWQTAIKTPLGILPTGSGNGIAASLFYEAGEDYSVEYAAFQIVNGGIQSHDIASIITESSKNYMVAMIHWAFTGDADIESEKIRFLGGDIRYALGALKCILFKKSYFGRLSYLPIEESNEETTEDNVSTHLLPTTVTDPVPENWKTVEGNFVLFICVLASAIAHNLVFFPDCVMGSGEFHLLFGFDESLTRVELLSMADSENFTTKRGAHYIRTRAFRLEPITTPGIISVDGENFDYVPFQAQAHKGIMRLFSRKKLL